MHFVRITVITTEAIADTTTTVILAGTAIIIFRIAFIIITTALTIPDIITIIMQVMADITVHTGLPVVSDIVLLWVRIQQHLKNIYYEITMFAEKIQTRMKIKFKLVIPYGNK